MLQGTDGDETFQCLGKELGVCLFTFFYIESHSIAQANQEHTI